jgi:hypothetical protein
MVAVSESFGGDIRNLGIKITEVPSIWDKSQEVISNSLKSTDTIADLKFFMDQMRVREVPIIDGTSGPVLEIVNLVDLVRFLPPDERLPRKWMASQGYNLAQLESEVTQFIEENSSVAIRDAFSDLFEAREDTPVPSFNADSKLRELFQVLIDNHYQIHKYLTLPIMDNDVTGKKVRRMWSYIDGLKLIQSDKSPEVEDFLSKTVNEISIKEVVTLNESNTLADASLKFSTLRFFPTHLPLRSDEKSNIVKGLVDDIVLSTLTHRIFRSLGKMPLRVISTPFSIKDTVKPSDSINTLIDVLVKRPQQPITVMVGEMSERGFLLQGIVNFVDIFSSFLKTFDK